MNKQRLENIVSLIKANGYSASVEFIASELGVSASTIRRDLHQLEMDKRIKRSYGKAECVEEITELLPFSIRFRKNIAEKMTACRLASTLVAEGDTVFIDASSTAYFLTRFLREIPNVKIVTNGVENINGLTNEKVEVYSTGGKLSNNNRIALVGKRALEFIRSMHANIAFMSAFAVCKNGGIYDICDDEVAVRQEMIKNSDKQVLVIDDKKLLKSAPFMLANVQDFDYLVCNKNISGYFDKNIKVELICEK